MKTRTLLPLLLVLATLPVAAQTPSGSTLVGATLGIEGGLQSTRIPVYEGSEECGLFEQGGGFSPSFGGTALFPRIFSERLGLSLTTGVAWYTGGFREEPVDPTRVLDEETNSPVTLERHYQLDEQEWTAFAELLVRYRLAGATTIALGGRAGYRFGLTSEQTDNITGPGDFAFGDGQRAHLMADGTPITPTSLDAGPTAALLFDFPLSPRTLFQPSVAFHANLLSPAEGFDWQRYNVGLRASLLFDVTPSEEPVRRPPPPVIADGYPRLAAAVELSGLDLERRPVPLARVSVNESIFRQVAPLLPAVFFEQDSTVLPDRYRLKGPSQADTFTIDGLAGEDVYEIQHHTLDIVGSRMRLYPEAKLTMVGSTSKDENGSLTRPRAEWVRGYLMRVWTIAPERLVIRDRANIMERSNEATEDGRSDNRRVELASNVPAILAPVNTQQVVRDFNPPYILVHPAVESEAGLARWDVQVRQGSKILASYNGTDESSLSTSDLSWKINDREIDVGLAPLEAHFHVVDVTGKEVTATDHVELQLVRRVRLVDGRIERTGSHERIAYTLVGFEFDRPEMGRQNEGFIRDIAELTRRGARITIKGYTDRIGDPKRNHQLSIERAQRVESTLRRALAERGITDADISTEGYGVETERFTNEVAEGRVLSRGVSVVVEQEASVP